MSFSEEDAFAKQSVLRLMRLFFLVSIVIAKAAVDSVLLQSLPI